MNIVLFETPELEWPLPRTDRRAQHVLDVLRRKLGDTFDAGVINGPRGRATITNITAQALSIAFDPTGGAPAVPPITLVVGLPRPQTARDVLRDATTVGVGAIHFVATERSEPSYAQSTLWSSGEWRRHALAGAEQAFDTFVPEVTSGQTLSSALTKLAEAKPDHTTVRIALDNYESPAPLLDVSVPPGSHVIVAIGCERGWSAAERDLLRASGYTFAHLGSRVLRTETAVVAALTLIRAKLGLG